MSAFRTLIPAIVLTAGVSPLGQEPAAVAILAELDEMAAVELWPGFTPRSTPIAIYDGERTWLFRHPSPPEPFEAHGELQDTWTMEGRHESVKANSNVEIGGVGTATLVAAGSNSTIRERAAVLVHETFHVFQGANHPDWFANEVDLFTYPVDDEELLALRRLETRALRRSLAAEVGEMKDCWAAEALELRSVRFKTLPESSVTYERHVELTEGLANYVESVAAAVLPSAIVPEDDYAVDGVRHRAYASGAAMASHLDRLTADWKGRLEAETVPLDELLAEAVGDRFSTEECRFDAKEQVDVLGRARKDVEALVAQRERRRNEFIEREGWRVVIRTEGEPLWPEGFDPLNVKRVESREILHTRWVKLGNSLGRVEVLDRETLTQGAGDHPLFNGVSAATITGLADEPSVTESAGVVKVTGPGLEAEFRAARIEREGRLVVIIVGDGG